MLKILLFALSTVLISEFNPALAGWVIKGPHVTIEVRQNMIRAGGPYRKMIYDLNKNQLTFVHFALAKFWRGSPGEFKKKMRELTKKELSKGISRMPPGLRKAYTRKIQERFSQTPDQKEYKVFIISRPKAVQIAGYGTTKTEIWVNQKLKEEIWQADIPGLLKEWDQKKFLFMTQEMSISGYQAWQRHPQVMQARARGVALKSIIHTPNGKKMGNRVFSIAKAELPAEIFRPPRGFEKATLAQLNP